MRKETSNKTYQDVHRWMRLTYGKAALCENTDCKGKSTHFEWCLKKENSYRKDRRAFLQLCKPCHVQYDMTPEWRKNIGKNRLGVPRPDVSKNMVGNQHARKIVALINCQWCRTLLKPKDRNTRFCSKSCVMKARNDAARKYLTL